MSLRIKTSQAIQKAGHAVFEANAAIAISVLEQKDFVLNMGADQLVSVDAANAFKDLQALASLTTSLVAIEESLKAIYAKSLELSSPQSTVLLGHSKVGHTNADVDATDVQSKEPVVKRGRKPKAKLAVTVIKPTSLKKPSVKFKGPNGETWTGQGRTPRWLTALEANGAPRSEFFVKV
jgi:hypothetical protein